MASSEPEAQPQPARENEGGTTREVSWLAGLLAVFTAMVVVGLLVRLAQGSLWGPVVAWLIAGMVAGAVVRRPTTAVKVAAVTAVLTGIVTTAVNELQFREVVHASSAEPLDLTPSPLEALLRTVGCAMACVLGAAVVAEVMRQRDAKRLRG